MARRRYVLSSFMVASIVTMGLFYFATKQQQSQERFPESASRSGQTVDSTDKDSLAKSRQPLKDERPLAESSSVPSSTAHMRSAHRSQPVILPDQPVSTYLEILTQAAKRGDAEAAYRISIALDRCAMYKGNPPHPSFAKELAKCQDLTEEQISQGLHWLQIAAENGNEAAQVRYAQSLGRLFPSRTELVRDPERLIQFKNDALRYLQSASLNGNVDAMVALAQNHKDGLIVPHDLEAVYAYLDVADRTHLLEPIPSLQYLRNELTAEQLARATQLGNQIYQQCCSR